MENRLVFSVWNDNVHSTDYIASGHIESLSVVSTAAAATVGSDVSGTLNVALSRNGGSSSSSDSVNGGDGVVWLQVKAAPDTTVSIGEGSTGHTTTVMNPPSECRLLRTGRTLGVPPNLTHYYTAMTDQYQELYRQDQQQAAQEEADEDDTSMTAIAPYSRGGGRRKRRFKEPVAALWKRMDEDLKHGDIPSDFDGEEYLRLHPDVVPLLPIPSSSITPTSRPPLLLPQEEQELRQEAARKHYREKGFPQGRAYTTSKLPVDFYGDIYVKKYPDLLTACGSQDRQQWGGRHWLDYGAREGRRYK